MPSSGRRPEPAAHARSQNIVIGIVLVGSAVAMPFSSQQMSQDTALVLVALTVMTFAQILTTVLMAQQFVVEGRSHLLLATTVMLWSSMLLMTLTAIFPSSLGAADDPRGDDPTWIWLLWSALYPLALGFVAITWDRWQVNLPFARSQALTLAIALVAVSTGAFAFGVLTLPLPTLTRGLDYTVVMNQYGQPIALLCAVMGFILTWTRRNEDVVGWFNVTNAAIVSGLALTYIAGGRFTVGWHLGRLFVALASTVVLVGFLIRVLDLQRDAVARSRVLRTQVQRDALTGAINRHGLEDQLEQLQYRRPAIAILDCDRFKVINDTFGHSTGDEFLAALAGRMHAALRQDDMLVRWGGDEFLLIVNDAPETALEAVQRIQSEVSSHPIKTRTHLLPVKISVGVADWRVGDSFDTTLQRADSALYASKARGGARVTHANSGTVDLRVREAQEAQRELPR